MYNFKDLTNKYEIQIPIIQRDYAQGRTNHKAKQIREVFLNSISKALSQEKETLHLDFIYGSIESGKFTPLDGQQRLTTLFLLHWYFGIKENKNKEGIDYLKNFTYETRSSSKEFIRNLINNEDDIEFIGKKNISKQIKDSSWFLAYWKNDPTIKAILVMLDDIHEKFTNDSFYDRLCRITFKFFELKDFKLDDDLYIKMNARGKSLTEFENFKAKFENYIEDKKFEEKLSPEETFSHKIDTIWTDLFWKYRGDNNKIDDKIINFIASVAINFYAENLEIFESAEEIKKIFEELEEKKGKNITDEEIKRVRIERRVTLLFNSPDKIIPEDFSSEKSFEYLRDCFDMYSHKDSHKEFKYATLKPKDLIIWSGLLKEKIQINSEEELDNNFFLNLVNNASTEYKQRVLFYAQTRFLLQLKSESKSFESQSFAEWMRVVRNIVQNATIDSASTYIGAIGLIKELSSGCTDNIYKFLNEKNSIKSNFASNQMVEEFLKLSIILGDEENKKIIFLTEDTNFFKGKISFGLFCIDCETNPDAFDLGKCSSLHEVVKEHLNSNDISNDFRRALLTVRGNDFYDYWKPWSHSLQLQKRCLIKDIADLKDKFIPSEYKIYLKELLVELFKKGSSLTNIISDFPCPNDMPYWKQRLIKEPKLLESHCEKHYFSISEDNKSCFLYRDKIRPRSIVECEEIQ